MKKIVIISGAGVSAESGIKTFRDSDGLWENYKISEVATPESWKKNPELVQDFYNARRKQILEAKPNDAHYYFAELEKKYDVQIITQNIDDLHERAGSTKVLHLHGNIRFAKSSGPNQEKKYYPIQGSKLSLNDLCDEGLPLRPHVVWFGEDVPLLEIAAEICRTAEILIVVGTSLQVYPAAGLVFVTKKDCMKYVIDPKVENLNLDESFVKINSNAVEGVKRISHYIKRPLQN
jgi:NAD-dependent deacetylase